MSNNPTIGTLEAQNEVIDRAEGAALVALVEAMREVAASLPAGSRLALTLARESKRVDQWTGRLDEHTLTFGRSSVQRVISNILEQQEQDWGEDDEGGV